MRTAFPARLILACLLIGAGTQLYAQEPVEQTVRKFSTDGRDGGTPHPLLPVIKFAYQVRDHIDATVRDYTCTLVKRERVKGELLGHEHILAKLRHRQTDANGETTTPFSFYLKCVAPSELAGREGLYVEGTNGDRVLVRRGGRRFAFIVTSIDPEGALALQRNRYPATSFGIRNLVERLIEVGERELQYDECEVKYFKDAKVNGSDCTRIRVIHPFPREHFIFHQADIYIDNKLQAPVRFVSYDFPAAGQTEPPLLEEYTYTDLKFNVGLTEEDFDPANPEYTFRSTAAADDAE